MNSASSNSAKRRVGNWTLEEVIGKGAQATVYRGRNIYNGYVGAIKEFRLNQFNEEQLKQVQMEIKLIKSFNHPYVISLLDNFCENGYLYIVYQYIARGSLYKVLRNGLFSNDDARGIIKEVLLGLAHIHESGVIHRDIKADNILIDDHNDVKIADFGISLVSNSKNDYATSDMSAGQGSSYWMAPERIEMKEPTTKSDIWSVGCVTLELLTGKPPYFDLNPIQAIFQIQKTDEITIKDVNNNITKECRDFLKECFVKDPMKRKSAKELLNHPWLNPRKLETSYSMPSSSQGMERRTSYKQETSIAQPLQSSSDLDSLLGDLNFDEIMKDDISFIEAEVNSRDSTLKSAHSVSSRKYDNNNVSDGYGTLTSQPGSRRSSYHVDTLSSQSLDASFQTKVSHRNSGRYEPVNSIPSSSTISQSQNGEVGFYNEHQRRSSARFDNLNVSSDSATGGSSSDKPYVPLPHPRSNPVIPPPPPQVRPQLPQPQQIQSQPPQLQPPQQQVRPQLPQPQQLQSQPPQIQPPPQQQVRPQLPQPQQVRSQLPQPQQIQPERIQPQPQPQPPLQNEELSLRVKNLDSLRKKFNKEYDESCIEDLKFIMKMIQKNRAYCSMLLANNLLFILVSLMMEYFKHYEMSALVLKIIQNLLESDSGSYNSFLMMGGAQILNDVTSSLLVPSSQTNEVHQTKEKRDIVSITVSIIQLLYQGDVHVLDLLYSSGGIMSMINLLNSNELEHVNAGIVGLTKYFVKGSSSLEKSVAMDLLLSKDLIDFLFKGLHFCINSLSLYAMYTAAKLLSVLTEYVEANDERYLEVIDTNEDLLMVIGSIVIEPNRLVDDLASYNIRSDNYLLSYKMKLMEFMIVHQTVEPIFNEGVLGMMIPLCDPRSPSLTPLVLQFLYTLIEKDTTLVILSTALDRSVSLLPKIKDLLSCQTPAIVSMSSKLLLFIGEQCDQQKDSHSLYSAFRMEGGLEMLISCIGDKEIGSKVMRFLSKKCVLDKAHFAELCRRSENDRILCNCYLDSEFSSKEENIEAFLSFVQSVQHILVDFSYKGTLIKTIIENMKSSNVVIQCAAMRFMTMIIKTNPDKKMFIASYRLLYVIKNIPRTDDNKKFYDELKRVTE